MGGAALDLLVAVVSVYAVAVVAPLVVRMAPRAAGWILAAAPAAVLAVILRHAAAVLAGEPVLQRLDWVPTVDATLSLRLDGLSFLFATLIAGIGALIVVYAGAYLAGEAYLGRFYAALFLFMGSMLGVVLADNLILLFVFWELTSLSSYFLIGYRHDDPASRRAALQALLVTGTGGMALLAGAVLLGQAGGSLELTDLLTGPHLGGHALYGPILILLLLAAFTKSAQFPFHFWLPNAMEAPTPVSAYLHSATMVKAGLYLVARINPILGGTEAWRTTIPLFGAATMLVGGYLALRHTDLKRVLAYTTVAALGAIMALLGVSAPLAAAAALTFLLAHALYKGALFLVAGAVDHGTGTRDLTRLGGLARAMPWTTFAALVAGVGLMGLPPLASFIAKEMQLDALSHAATLGPTLLVAAVGTNAFFAAAALRILHRPFFGPRRKLPHEPHEAGVGLLLGPFVLALFSLFAVVAAPVTESVLAAAAASVAGQAVDFHLQFWHGFNLPLLLSASGVVLGILIYANLERLAGVFRPLDALSRWGPDRAYDVALRGLFGLARLQTRILQHGYLRYYLLLIVGGWAFVAGATYWARAVLPELPPRTLPPLNELIVALVIFTSAIYVALARSRLAAVVALGAVGYGIALIFIFYGAPDLAMTQFLFETLSVLLFVLVLVHLPRLTHHSSRAVRLRDGAISVLIGLFVAGLVLATTAHRFHPTISDYFAENSYTEAHGRNVVNVILVDFRGLDTLGEITVLAVSALGVFALLRLRQSKEAKK